jgi:LacI family transcriptional regulator
VARKTAFEKSMQEIGLSSQLVFEGDHTMEGGMRLLTQLLRGKSRPSAVMGSNDMTAIGVMRQAYDEGVRVPQDLSVIGFDDIRLAQFVTPPLTTIQMSQSEIARIAFEALMTETERETSAKGRVDYDLTTSLVLRRSTAMPRK